MLELFKLNKSYGQVHALSGVNLRVGPGEIVALAGPSGAGKTTTLHIASGVLSPTEGSVQLDGNEITGLAPWKRDFALVQESYALYPHMTVAENISFPLRSPLVDHRIPEHEIRDRVNDVAEAVGLSPLLEFRIQHLSGGQRQRVALARALVRTPQAFLLDEPIAHLDAKLRHWLRGELRRRLTATGRPCVWATPDGKEALSVADRVAVIVRGQIAQFGTPREVFLRPATARVAEIMSEPPITLLKGNLDLDGPKLWFEDVPEPVRVAMDGDLRPVAGKVLAGVRASELRIRNGGARVPRHADVLAREFTTRETVVSVKFGSQSLRVLTEPFSEFSVNDRVVIDWAGARIYLFEAEGGRRLVSETRVLVT
jgi:multiple sugar transport system ATP-binding protein